MRKRSINLSRLRFTACATAEISSADDEEFGLRRLLLGGGALCGRGGDSTPTPVSRYTRWRKLSFVSLELSVICVWL